MLKVCFLVGTLGRGGAERQLLYMLHALQNTDVSTRVLCLTSGESYEKDVKALGVPFEYVGASGLRPVRLYQIIQSLRRDSADIIQSSHFYTNLYAAAAARILKRRSIGAIRSNLTSELESNGMAGLWHLRLPRFLIANSTIARERAIAKGISPERIFFVSNVVETENTTEKLNRQIKDVFNVLFVGRLTQEKRADRFLRVVSRLKRELPEKKIKAQIVGDGPLMPQVQAQAKELGLNGSLELLGQREDMAGIYRNADLLMLTSDYEGTPNVLLEAMGHGIPIVASDVGGVSEIINDERGFLIQPEDEDGFTKTAIRLTVDKDLRAKFGLNGQDYVRRFHSLKTLQSSLTEIYQKVLAV
jgi:glycosyltransferase involved in cell wall biosynthesis